MTITIMVKEPLSDQVREDLSNVMKLDCGFVLEDLRRPNILVMAKVTSHGIDIHMT
jgi:hypothetical protein